jgi:tripartite-type tricarboxylate transporter receptor subunit TctC
LPDVPTTREAGFNFDASIWSGLFAPKGTPADVVKKLTETMRDALNDLSVKDFEQKSGILHGYIDPAAARRQMEAEANGLRPVMNSLGLVKK